jgi:hypothetical protein
MRISEQASTRLSSFLLFLLAGQKFEVLSLFCFWTSNFVQVLIFLSSSWILLQIFFPCVLTLSRSLWSTSFSSTPGTAYSLD